MEVRKAFGYMWLILLGSLASNVVVRCAIRNIRMISKELDKND